MNIDKNTINKISKLSYLEFNEKEEEEISNDLNRILEFVDKLNELDTKNVEPLVYIGLETNILREDKVKQEISKKEALKNAPHKDSDYFKVPKVL